MSNFVKMVEIRMPGLQCIKTPFLNTHTRVLIHYDAGTFEMLDRTISFTSTRLPTDEALTGFLAGV